MNRTIALKRELPRLTGGKYKNVKGLTAAEIIQRLR